MSDGSGVCGADQFCGGIPDGGDAGVWVRAPSGLDGSGLPGKRVQGYVEEVSIVGFCELGYCPYADDEELTCEDCPYWVDNLGYEQQSCL